MILEYKNRRIYYSLKGKGDVILLLHGFLEDSTMWQPFLEELTASHSVLCIDLLGHGKSDNIGNTHTMKDMATAVFSVLQAKTITKIKCIGHSMGGYVALALAEEHPKLFDSLCLMNSTFEADDTQRKALRQRANVMAKTNFKQLVHTTFINLFAPESKQRFQPEIKAALNTALNTSVQGYIACQEAMRLRPNRFKVLKKLKAKKYIIIGKKDWVVNAQRLKDACQGTNIDIIEFTQGHMSHIENKKELISFFRRFME